MSVPPRQIWLVLIGLHVALLAHALPVGVLLGDSPFGGADYQTHYQHTHTLLQVQAEFGRAWAYDPNLLAGHPTGLIFDVDNKLHFGWTSGLVRLGVPLPVAFNLFTLLACALAPVSLWLAARLLRLEAGARVLAFGLGALVWGFDPTAAVLLGGRHDLVRVRGACVGGRHRGHASPASSRAGGGCAGFVGAAAAGAAHARVELRDPRGAVDRHVSAELSGDPREGASVVWAAAALGLLVNLDWLVPALRTAS